MGRFSSLLVFLKVDMNSSDNPSRQTPWAIIIMILLIVSAILAWQLLKDDSQDEQKQQEAPAVIEEPKIIEEVVVPEATPEEIIPEPVAEEVVYEPEEPEVEIILPALDESDSWIQTKLSSLTWRKELLKLVINEDMIRRFVVFTDNFAQGSLAYEHSPFVTPNASFSVLELKEEGMNELSLFWDEKTTRRFSLYVDLLRSIDSDTLVTWYMEAKPLVDQAYAELGYPDEDFTEVLQAAITRVLDMEIPREPIELVQPSVMYKYKSEKLESLEDTDKLLLRLGKDNLLVIKSVLLEINEKITRKRS